MNPRPKKKRDRKEPKQHVTAGTDSSGVQTQVGAVALPEVIERAKRLEKKLIKWLEQNPANAELFAKNPALVIREFDPTIEPDITLDPTLVTEFITVLEQKGSYDLFEVWWSWVNASSSHFSAYHANPVGTVVTAGAGFPADQVKRLMDAVAYVTGCTLPLELSPGILAHTAAMVQVELGKASHPTFRTSGGQS